MLLNCQNRGRMLTWDYCQWPHYVNNGYFKKYKRSGIYFLGRGRGRDRGRMCVMNGLILQVPPLFSWKLLPASLYVVVRVTMASVLYFGAALSVLGSPVRARQLLVLLKSSSPLSWLIWTRHSLHRHSSGTRSIFVQLQVKAAVVSFPPSSQHWHCSGWKISHFEKLSWEKSNAVRKKVINSLSTSLLEEQARCGQG